MRTSVLVSIVAVAGAAAQALAGMNGPPLQISAIGSSGEVLGSLTVQQSWGSWNNGQWSWQATQPMPILSSTGQTLGTLAACSLSYVNDPVVNLNFTITAGSSGNHFIFTSAQLLFPTINPATGDASGGYSLTDSDHVGGATATGNFPGGTLFRPFYNGFPGGTTFADIVSGIAAPLNGTNSTSANVSPTAIGAVTDISAQWDFNLSANDTLSASSTFEVVPAPGAGALLALGGLAALRRRR
jgi:uncharacterized protein (TIGR03382 family)